MPVGYTRPEVQIQLARWNVVRDCLAGQEVVKSKGPLYLPMPNKADTSQANQDRYAAYVDRAVFYNVTRRTLDGLVGQVFSRDPVVEMPDSMDLLKNDVDGAGVGLDQQAKKAMSGTTAFGRQGLLVDYPPTSGPASKADQDAGFVRPTITLYEPWEIINWRTVSVGARRIFSLVVISETYILDDDGFESKSGLQYRVLRLVPPARPEGAPEDAPVDWTQATYAVEIWRLDSVADGGTMGGMPGAPSKGAVQEFSIHLSYEPRDANGNLLTEIPFTFVGAMNNDPGVDHSPLYDLAVLNIAHYRNSADYEEACFITGQPTPVLSGLTKTWVDEVLQGQVMLGSRAAVMLPQNGSATLLQASPNTMPKEAMETKEKQMVALGAKLVEHRQVQRTAQEARTDDASSSSILSSIAANVSEAYTVALKWCAMFMDANLADDDGDVDGGGDSEISYTLNRDFPAARMNAQDLQQLVATWQARGIAFSEFRNQLRSAGIATLDDEAAKEEIDSDPPSPGISSALAAAMGGQGAGGAGSGSGEGAGAGEGEAGGANGPGGEGGARAAA